MNERMLDQLDHKLDRIERYSLLAAKNVLTFDDVAFLTGMSKSYLYKLTCSQQIPHYKPNGKQIYFDRQEIEDWLKQNRIATAKEIDQNATNYVVTGRMRNGGAAL
jgi:excisionase family DNA binding protein